MAAAVTRWREWFRLRWLGGHWIAGVRATSDGLLLPGHPQGWAADLLLTSRGVTVFGQGRAAELAWEEHRAPFEGDLRSGWRVANVPSLGSETGIGLTTWGHTTTAIAPVRRTARSWGAPAVPAGTAIVPLHPLAWFEIGQSARVDALCAVLAERPAVRERLADLRRTRPLAEALASSRLGPRSAQGAFRRSTVEVMTALKAVGYVHRLYGRPVPGDPLPDQVQAETRVREHLARSPYARGVVVSPKTVAQLVRSEYLDVQPWPFQALLR